MTDITYTVNQASNMISFWPETDAGTRALAEFAAQLRVSSLAEYDIHMAVAMRGIRDMRAAGYSVCKARPSRISDDQAEAMIAELLA
jgi:hypothetical protein